jgi:hypothetical protein
LILNKYPLKIEKFGTSDNISYGVSAELPEKYRKWIANIIGNEYFRNKVKKEIESIFANQVFNSQSYIKITWFVQGPSFQTDGINDCSTYVPYLDPSSYSHHNIDNYEQASILHIALSIYLQNLYPFLEDFETGEKSSEEYPPLKDRIVNKITLKKVEDCKMTYEQCIHKGRLCELCGRNPKAYHLLSQKDIKRIGDKWEPRGGLPGRKLCPVCGANISSDECPFCQTK